jgi:hypothetical protein
LNNRAILVDCYKTPTTKIFWWFLFGYSEARMKLPLVSLCVLLFGLSGLHADNLCVADDSKLSVGAYPVTTATFPGILAGPVMIAPYTSGNFAYCFCMLTAASGEKYLAYTYTSGITGPCASICDALKNKYLQ